MDVTDKDQIRRQRSTEVFEYTTDDSIIDVQKKVPTAGVHSIESSAFVSVSSQDKVRNFFPQMHPTVSILITTFRIEFGTQRRIWNSSGRSDYQGSRSSLQVLHQMFLWKCNNVWSVDSSNDGKHNEQPKKNNSSSSWSRCDSSRIRCGLIADRSWIVQ